MPESFLSDSGQNVVQTDYLNGLNQKESLLEMRHVGGLGETFPYPNKKIEKIKVKGVSKPTESLTCV